MNHGYGASLGCRCKRRHSVTLVLAWVVAFVLGGYTVFAAGDSTSALSSDNSTFYKRLGHAEWWKFLALEQMAYPDNPAAVGNAGAITGSFHPLAQRAGLLALDSGGTSVDAAMTTALAQIALGAGGVISYFGILNMVHYDATSGTITSLNGGWNTLRNENDPMSIPGGDSATSQASFYGEDRLSGRSALVGGFMRALEAAHSRYGKLAFNELFDPAIYIAETGVPFTRRLEQLIVPHKEKIGRLPASKAVFTNAAGHWIEAGETFKQPMLANTLRAIAEKGADYMYEGPWAEKAVEILKENGSKITLHDLRSYRILWVEPIIAEHAGYHIYANGLPSYGGVNMVEALHLGRAAKIHELGHWSENSKSFRSASDITFNSMLSTMPEKVRKQLYPGLDLSLASRTRYETAAALWQRMESGQKLAEFVIPPSDSHSDTVVAVDRWGNMTAVTHSINSSLWGAGIIVDGITIGNPAVSQKGQVASVKPGSRLPDPIELGILTKDGSPVLAFASMAMGLHQQTFQSLFNFMNFDMDVKEAVDAPAFFQPKVAQGEYVSTFYSRSYKNDSNTKWIMRVQKDTFPDAVLKESRLPVEQLCPHERNGAHGLWVGISKDPRTKSLMAASHPYSNGRALAQ